MKKTLIVSVIFLLLFCLSLNFSTAIFAINNQNEANFKLDTKASEQESTDRSVLTTQTIKRKADSNSLIDVLILVAAACIIAVLVKWIKIRKLKEDDNISKY